MGNKTNKEYPKLVRAREVVNTYVSSNLFKLPGGRVCYDKVWMADGGEAVYLVRVYPDLRVLKRWVHWSTYVWLMFNPEVKCESKTST